MLSFTSSCEKKKEDIVLMEIYEKISVTESSLEGNTIVSKSFAKRTCRT